MCLSVCLFYCTGHRNQMKQNQRVALGSVSFQFSNPRHIPILFIFPFPVFAFALALALDLNSNFFPVLAHSILVVFYSKMVWIIQANVNFQCSVFSVLLLFFLSVKFFIKDEHDDYFSFFEKFPKSSNTGMSTLNVSGPWRKLTFLAFFLLLLLIQFFSWCHVSFLQSLSKFLSWQ